MEALCADKYKWRVCYGLSKSDHFTDAEVSGYRFQPQRQRHVLEDTLEASDHEKKDTRKAELTKKNKKLAEMVSTGGGADIFFLDAVTSLSAVMKRLQLVNARSKLMKVNIKLSIIVIA